MKETSDFIFKKKNEQNINGSLINLFKQNIIILSVFSLQIYISSFLVEIFLYYNVFKNNKLPLLYVLSILLR